MHFFTCFIQHAEANGVDGFCAVDRKNEVGVVDVGRVSERSKVHGWAFKTHYGGAKISFKAVDFRSVEQGEHCSGMFGKLFLHVYMRAGVGLTCGEQGEGKKEGKFLHNKPRLTKKADFGNLTY